MNVGKKSSIENQKQASEKNLSMRLELLKSKSKDDLSIQRDSRVKQFKAEIRAARRRLASIAAKEALIVQKTEAKAKKLEAMKAPAPPKKKAAADAAPKKAKKAKAVKKEKG